MAREAHSSCPLPFPGAALTGLREGVGREGERGNSWLCTPFLFLNYPQFLALPQSCYPWPNPLRATQPQGEELRVEQKPLEVSPPPLVSGLERGLPKPATEHCPLGMRSQEWARRPLQFPPPCKPLKGTAISWKSAGPSHHDSLLKGGSRHKDRKILANT